MFTIEARDDGVVVVTGRLDAAQAPRAQEVLDALVPERGAGPCTIDMAGLEYISSAGLGVLLRTHKRLMPQGQALRLVSVSAHINDIFGYSGFDRLFTIERAD